MREFVICPSCGQAVRVPDGLVSLLVLCRGCGLTFQATVPEAPRPPRAGERCRGCGRLLREGDDWCSSCDESLDGVKRWLGQTRRDCEPHRAGLIAFLANMGLMTGVLSCCVGGLTVPLALPLGITAWAMANNDLRKMRAGVMDREGIHRTYSARSNAVAGVVFSTASLVLYVLLFLLLQHV